MKIERPFNRENHILELRGIFGFKILLTEHLLTLPLCMVRGLPTSLANIITIM